MFVARKRKPSSLSLKVRHAQRFNRCVGTPTCDNSNRKYFSVVRLCLCFQHIANSNLFINCVPSRSRPTSKLTISPLRDSYAWSALWTAMGTNLENKSVNLDEAGLDSGKDLARAARPMGPKASMSGILSWYMNSLSFLSSVASRLILPSHVWTEKKTVLSKP